MAQPAANTVPPLASIGQVLTLNNDQADFRPFHLRAQITVSQPKIYRFFLQDHQLGIYFNPKVPGFHWQVGAWVEVEGVVRSGLFAPILEVRRAEIVGHGPLPKPVEVGREDQLIPEAGNVWSIAHGQILRQRNLILPNRSMNLDLRLASGEIIQVSLYSVDQCNLDALIDQDVAVRGIVSDIAYRSQNTHHSTAYHTYELAVSGCQDVQITAPPGDGRLLPLVPISSLLAYHSGTSIGSLVHVSGVVTSDNGSDGFFLQQDASGVLVEPKVPGAVPPVGASIQVTGRLAPGDQSIRRLVSATFRAADRPQHTRISQLGESDLYVFHSAGQLDTIEGLVTSRNLLADRAAYGLLLQRAPFSAVLVFPNGDQPRDLPEIGDRVRITGIGEAEKDLEQGHDIITFQLRSPSDFVIVQRRPLNDRLPWRRITLAAGGLILLGFFWITSLSNRVRVRTRQLEEANRSTELARKQAEEASRAKGEFLASMSHEIRTPMNGVIGMTHLILETTLTPVQLEYVKTIRSSGQALLSIISDILDFSKIEAGKMELENGEFELRNVLEECRDVVSLTAAKKDLSLSIEVAEDVPISVIGDAGRLRQILLNLLSNAVKFTERGAVCVNLVCRPPPQEDQSGLGLDLAPGEPEDTVGLAFTVRDTGIGLTTEQQGRLFQAFTQADPSTTRRFGGTGLGLSIAKRLVEMMNGTIGLTSQVGVGTAFWFNISVRRGTVAKPAAVSESSPVQGDSDRIQQLFAGRGLRILVADDVITNRYVAAGILKKMGLDADAVENGLEALAAIQSTSYDLILMDVHMPVLDGLDATRQIRNAEKGRRRLPIIALTAAAMKEDRAQCLAAGMDDFVSKPIMPRIMAAALIKWLPAKVDGIPAEIQPLDR